MDLTDDIFSKYPGLRHRINDKDYTTTEVFLNILSMYGATDAMRFVDTMIISKGPQICIIKDKPGKREDNAQPIDLVNLFISLLKRRLGSGVEVFDDMLKQEITDFVYGLMMRYKVPPALEDAYEQEENI